MNKTDHIKTIRVYREPLQLELPFPPPITSEEALDWALTYIRAAMGSDIDENEEYKQAVEVLERNEVYCKVFNDIY